MNALVRWLVPCADEDIFPIPGGHNPKSSFSSSRSNGCSESEFREFIASRADVLSMYNSYFGARARYIATCQPVS